MPKPLGMEISGEVLFVEEGEGLASPSRSAFRGVLKDRGDIDADERPCEFKLGDPLWSNEPVVCPRL
jgi:hypothetical protein